MTLTRLPSWRMIKMSISRNLIAEVREKSSVSRGAGGCFDGADARMPGGLNEVEQRMHAVVLKARVALDARLHRQD
jgi:hypothetical protein